MLVVLSEDHVHGLLDIVEGHVGAGLCIDHLLLIFTQASFSQQQPTSDLLGERYLIFLKFSKGLLVLSAELKERLPNSTLRLVEVLLECVGHFNPIIILPLGVQPPQNALEAIVLLEGVEVQVQVLALAPACTFQDRQD